MQVLSFWMPPNGLARVKFEATTDPEGRPVVFVHIDGYRFVTSAPSAARAREIVVELCKVFGLECVDG